MRAWLEEASSDAMFEAALYLEFASGGCGAQVGRNRLGVLLQRFLDRCRAFEDSCVLSFSSDLFCEEMRASQGLTSEQAFW